MEELLKQAPSNLDEDFIKEVYDKNNGDFAKSLMELWDIKEISKVQMKEQTKEQKEWNEIRETCDSFDSELNKVLKRISI